MTDWQDRFSRQAKRAIPSAIRALASFPRAADTIPFGPGEPDASLFPIEPLRNVLCGILDDVSLARGALQYGPSEGDLLLRERICTRMALLGVACHPDNVLLTNGSQQALHLVSQAFVDPYSTVLVQSPTYPGTLQVFLTHGARLAAVSSDVTRSALIYAMSTFQNPTGVSLSLAQRQDLVDLARSLDSILVEDDPYEVLRYEGEALPSLLSIDIGQRSIEDVRTIYLGTFSKSIAPGLRVGWAVGPKIVIEKLTLLKQIDDLQASSFAQAVLIRLLAQGVEPFAALIQATYRERRDRMAEALRTEFGNRGAWNVPEGGFFFWLTLPPEVDTARMLQIAAQNGVTYVPGVAFTHDGSGSNRLRLSFSSVDPDRVAEGVRRLAAAYDAYRT
jgi:DNA-binding transcriptional MocR family regulator